MKYEYKNSLPLAFVEKYYLLTHQLLLRNKETWMSINDNWHSSHSNFRWLENWKVSVLSIRVIKWNSWMPMSNFYRHCISNIPVDSSFIRLFNIYILFSPIRIVFWVLNMVQIEYQTSNRILCCLSIEISNFIHLREK